MAGKSNKPHSRQYSRHILSTRLAWRWKWRKQLFGSLSGEYFLIELNWFKLIVFLNAFKHYYSGMDPFFSGPNVKKKFDFFIFKIFYNMWAYNKSKKSITSQLQYLYYYPHDPQVKRFFCFTLGPQKRGVHSQNTCNFNRKSVNFFCDVMSFIICIGP